LRFHGRQTQAIIFDRWQEKDSEGDSVFYIAYAFKVSELQGRQRIITRAEQNRILYPKLSIGDTLVIRYLADNPSICKIQSKPEIQGKDLRR
jgi:hypothetical protein